MKDKLSLDNLHDIYIPPIIGFEWGDGHSLLLILLISVLITLSYLYISYFLATRFKREALSELKYHKEINDISAVFELVKRVLLTTCRREDVANLSGASLLEFMRADTIVLKLNNSIYNKNIKVDEAELEKFYKEIQTWIKEQKAIYD